jgi:cobalt/nickel transport system permease protein
MEILVAHFENHARRSTGLHRLDPRVKLLLLAAYTVAVVTTSILSWPAFAVYAALLAGAALAARLPPRYLLTRMAVVLPFILMAAIFLPFHSTLPQGWTGWTLFLNFAVKSALGAGAAVVVTASTPFPRLLAGLEMLRVPRVVVMIFSFTYRYLFVLVEEAQRMKRALDSRAYRGRWLGDVSAIGRMIGTLFLRSYERGERVYLAMLSRCFEGTGLSRSTTPRLAAPDLAALAAVGVVLVATWTTARFPW